MNINRFCKAALPALAAGAFLISPLLARAADRLPYAPTRPGDPLYSYYTGDYGTPYKPPKQMLGTREYYPSRYHSPYYSYYTGDYSSPYSPSMYRRIYGYRTYNTYYPYYSYPYSYSHYPYFYFSIY